MSFLNRILPNKLLLLINYYYRKKDSAAHAGLHVIHGMHTHAKPMVDHSNTKVLWTKLSTNSPTPDCASPPGNHVASTTTMVQAVKVVRMQHLSTPTAPSPMWMPLASTHTHILINSGLPAKLPLKPRQTFSWQAFSPRSKLQAGHVTTLGCRPLIIGIGVIGLRTPATTP